MQFRDPETLKLIQETAQSAAGAKDKVAILTLPGEPTGVYGVAKADGSYQRVVAEPPARNHKILSVDQVPLLVKHFADLTIDPHGESPGPSIWYSPEFITVLAMDLTLVADLRPRGQLEMKTTPQLKLLRKLEESEHWLDQKAFVAMLRLKFSDCLDRTNGDIVKVLRKMRFNTSVTQRGNIEHGRESLGSDITNDAFGDSDDQRIPETILLNVQLFDDPSLINREPVKCALEVDTTRAQLMIAPLAGELTRAMDRTMAKLAELLHASCDPAPIFYGKP